MTPGKRGRPPGSKNIKPKVDVVPKRGRPRRRRSSSSNSTGSRPTFPTVRITRRSTGSLMRPAETKSVDWLSQVQPEGASSRRKSRKGSHNYKDPASDDDDGDDDTASSLEEETGKPPAKEKQNKGDTGKVRGRRRQERRPSRTGPSSPEDDTDSEKKEARKKPASKDKHEKDDTEKVQSKGRKWPERKKERRGSKTRASKDTEEDDELEFEAASGKRAKKEAAAYAPGEPKPKSKEHKKVHAVEAKDESPRSNARLKGKSQAKEDPSGGEVEKKVRPKTKAVIETLDEVPDKKKKQVAPATVARKDPPPSKEDANAPASKGKKSTEIQQAAATVSSKATPPKAEGKGQKSLSAKKDPHSPSKSHLDSPTTAGVVEKKNDKSAATTVEKTKEMSVSGAGPVDTERRKLDVSGSENKLLTMSPLASDVEKTVEESQAKTDSSKLSSDQVETKPVASKHVGRKEKELPSQRPKQQESVLPQKGITSHEGAKATDPAKDTAEPMGVKSPTAAPKALRSRGGLDRMARHRVVFDADYGKEKGKSPSSAQLTEIKIDRNTKESKRSASKQTEIKASTEDANVEPRKDHIEKKGPVDSSLDKAGSNKSKEEPTQITTGAGPTLDDAKKDALNTRAEEVSPAIAGHEKTTSAPTSQETPTAKPEASAATTQMEVDEADKIGVDASTPVEGELEAQGQVEPDRVPDAKKKSSCSDTNQISPEGTEIAGKREPSAEAAPRDSIQKVASEDAQIDSGTGSSIISKNDNIPLADVDKGKNIAAQEEPASTSDDTKADAAGAVVGGHHKTSKDASQPSLVVATDSAAAGEQEEPSREANNLSSTVGATKVDVDNATPGGQQESSIETSNPPSTVEASMADTESAAAGGKQESSTQTSNPPSQVVAADVNLESAAIGGKQECGASKPIATMEGNVEKPEQGEGVVVSSEEKVEQSNEASGWAIVGMQDLRVNMSLAAKHGEDKTTGEERDELETDSLQGESKRKLSIPVEDIKIYEETSSELKSDETVGSQESSGWEVSNLDDLVVTMKFVGPQDTLHGRKRKGSPLEDTENEIELAKRAQRKSDWGIGINRIRIVPAADVRNEDGVGAVVLKRLQLQYGEYEGESKAMPKLNHSIKPMQAEEPSSEKNDPSETAGDAGTEADDELRKSDEPTLVHDVNIPPSYAFKLRPPPTGEVVLPPIVLDELEQGETLPKSLSHLSPDTKITVFDRSNGKVYSGREAVPVKDLVSVLKANASLEPIIPPAGSDPSSETAVVRQARSAPATLVREAVRKQKSPSPRLNYGEMVRVAKGEYKNEIVSFERSLSGDWSEVRKLSSGVPMTFWVQTEYLTKKPETKKRKKKRKILDPKKFESLFTETIDESFRDAAPKQSTTYKGDREIAKTREAAKRNVKITFAQYFKN